MTAAKGLVEGKAALVTGAAGGIGRAAALALAREGAAVVVADIQRAGAEETVELIGAAGGLATAVVGDVTDASEVKNWARTVENTYGPIECAFNNAGIAGASVGGGGKLLADWPEDGFDRMIEVNLKSVWLCMREEIQAMLAHGRGGSIINTSSIAGVVALRTSAAYGAAKHGVIGLTKIAAVEYAKQRIRVNAIAPGFIETPLSVDTVRGAGTALTDQIPLGRIGHVTEIAELVVWLCSDGAKYLTGQTIIVDGGYVAQ